MIKKILLTPEGLKEKEDEKKSGQAKPAAPAEDKAAGDLEES